MITAGIEQNHRHPGGQGLETGQPVGGEQQIIFRQQLKAHQAVEKIRAELPHCRDSQNMADFITASERGIQR